MERGGFAGQDGPSQSQGVRAQRGPVEAAGADQQRARGIQVGVGSRLRVLDAAVLPQERDQPVRAAQVLLRPRPDRVEALRVADRCCQQHAVGLTLADRVSALVEPLDATIGRDVPVQEVPCRGGGGRGLGRGRAGASGALATSAAADADKQREHPHGQRAPAADRPVHGRPQAGTSSPRVSAGSTDSASGARGFTSAGQHPVMRMETWTAAKHTLLSVAASGS